MLARQKMLKVWCVWASLAFCNLGVAIAADTGEIIQVDAGKQRVISFRAAPERVAVGDPATADVQMIAPRELLITAKRAGTTNLHVWFHGRKQAWQADLLVTAASRGQQQAIARDGLSVDSIGERTRLEGASTSLPAHAQAVELLNRKDAPLVDASALAFDTQVQTEIKVVEISREKLKSAGFFFGKNTANTTAAVSGPGNLSSVETANPGGFTLKSASGFLPNAQGFNIVAGNANEGLLGVISALENGGFAATLAEPTLVSLSGQTASFLVGGEFPVPVAQGGSSTGSISITYKEFGVRLQLTPTVLDADRINLKVAPEVSELDFAAGIKSGGVVVPALRVRRTDTTIQLGNGESFVISGLVSQNTVASVDKLPGLGDLPVLGAFFRASRIQKEDKELIMVVTPHLVRPLARGAATPALPGAAYRNYDPSFPALLFKGDRDFPAVRDKSGFSE